MEEKTTRYINVLEDRFGKAIGIAKIREDGIKEIVFREIYFVRYEKNPVRLVFTYYNSDKGWMLNAFKWDDNFIEEIK